MARMRDDKDEAGPSAGPFEPVSTYVAALGESPVWCPDTTSVWWVDCVNRMLVNTRPQDATRTWPTPETIGFVALAFGRVLVGLETGLFAFDPRSGRFGKVLALEDREVRFNDAATGAGHLWATTMDRGVERPIGSVLRIGPDFTARTCFAGFRRGNGLAVDPVRSRLYVSDSHPDVADIRFAPIDPATGDLGDLQPFVPGSARPGRPDGAALDGEGNYWIARVDAGLVDVMSPGGALVAGIPVPVPEPTKIAFGGPDGRTLFLTSKAKGPWGGTLLAARLTDDRSISGITQ